MNATNNPHVAELLLGIAALQTELIRPTEFSQMLPTVTSGDDPDAFTRHLRGLCDDDAVDTLRDVARRLMGMPEADLNGAIASLCRTMETMGFNAHEAATLQPFSSALSDDDSTAPPTLAEAPGRYRFPKEHAQGGMGKILIVYDEYLARQIALKELLPNEPISSIASTLDARGSGSESISAQRRVRFLNEARITGQLEHPSIVPVYELGHRTDGKPYYTMRLVRGRTLRSAIRESQNLTDRLSLLPHFTDLCQAIAFAHSRGVIHRDIKPGNVMVGEFGETIVIDWGLAKSRSTANAVRRDEALQQEEVDLIKEADVDVIAVGTPAYMPPEQARGDMEAIDERSDVYSLGAVLYELLTGFAPFPDKSPAKALGQLLAAPPRPVHDLVPEAPEELAAICDHAMARTQNDRYQSARELSADIDRFLTGRLVGVYSYKPMDLLRHFARRFKAPLAVAGIGLVILASTGIVAYRQVQAERNRAIVESQRAQHAERTALDARYAAEREFYFAAIASGREYIANFRYEKALALLDKCPEPFRHWEWGHLLYQCNQDQRTLQAHVPDTVWSLEFSPDGHLAFSSGFDNTARIWNVATGALEHTYSSPHGPVIEVSPHPSEPLLACAETGGTVTLLNTTDASIVRSWKAFDDGDVNCVQFSPNGQYIATGDDGGNIRIWDATTGETIRHILPVDRGIEALKFSADGQWLASANRSHDVSVWNVKTGSLQHAFTGHTNRVTSLDFHPNGDYLVSGGRDSQAIVWSVETGNVVQNLLEHDAAVWAVAFSPDGSTLATTGADLSIRLWDTTEWRTTRSFRGHLRQIYCLAFSPDSQLLLSGDNQGEVKFWDTHAPGPLVERWEMNGHTGTINSVAYSPDGSHLVTSAGDWQTSNDTTARLWDADTGALVRVLSGHEKSVRHAAFHPTETIVVTSSHDHTARVWKLNTENAARVLGPWDAEVNVTAFDPIHAEQMAIGLRDGAVLVVNWTNGTVLRQWHAHEGEVLSLNYSPDGQWLVSTSSDTTAHIMRSDTGERLHVLQHEEARIPAAAFSPDGKWLATGGHDWRIHLWDTTSWESARLLIGHTQGVHAVCFSDDGRRLLSSSSDGVTILWDMDTFREVMQMEGWIATMRPGSNDIATGTTSGAVYLWPAFHWDSENYPGANDTPLRLRAEAHKQSFWKSRLQP